MKQQGLVVIGTDTDAGKTFFTARFGALLRRQEEHSALLKPIASGAKIDHKGRLYSEDCYEIKRFAYSEKSALHIVNGSPIEDKHITPIMLQSEYSPKIAARLHNTSIDLDKVTTYVKHVVEHNDYTVIESAGGITTPLTEYVRLDQWLVELDYPLLLIADGKLGSINRALLTAFHAKNLGLTIIGIIVNDQNNSEPFLLNTNFQDMAQYTGIPVLSTLPLYDGPKHIKDELLWAKKYIPYETILLRWSDYYKQRRLHV